VIQFARQGCTDLHFPIYDTDWDSEPISRLGQNSNNTVRVTDEFPDGGGDGEWDLTWRTSGKIAKTLKRAICGTRSATRLGQRRSGLQFHTTINDWHTCPASGEIRASNRASEYMFLDDTACNLASLNLLTFHDKTTRQLDSRLRDAVRRDRGARISVMMRQFPSKEIAALSFEFRTLGLGYANVGGL